MFVHVCASVQVTRSVFLVCSSEISDDLADVAAVSHVTVTMAPLFYFLKKVLQGMNQKARVLLVNKWKLIIESAPHFSQTCCICRCVFVGERPNSFFTASPPRPFSHYLSSPVNFPPPLSPPIPRFPSSVCFCSLDSLSVPTFRRKKKLILNDEQAVVFSTPLYFGLFLLCYYTHTHLEPLLWYIFMNNSVSHIKLLNDGFIVTDEHQADSA